MIPQELKKYKNFVVWRYEERDGRKTKIPYNAVTRQRAKSNDPATWNAWDEVETAPAWANGIGFMFSNSPFVGVDIDHCLDGGEQEEQAAKIADLLGTYCEVSPSGEGLHMIGRGELEKGTRRGRVEIYPHGRYFTLTGNIWRGFEAIADIQPGLNELVNQAAKTESGERYPQGEDRQQEAPPQAAGLSPDEVIEKIRRSRQAELFAALFDRGDTALYNGDESAADLALMNILPFWCGGDVGKMEAVFSLSALGQREKWIKRPDYRRRTIEATLKNWNGEIYNPPTSKGKEPLPHIPPLKRNSKKINLTREQLKELALLPATDTGNAERLQLAMGDTIRYLPEKGRGAAWYKWNGKKWEAVFENSLYNTVTYVMEQAKKEAKRLLKDPQTEGKEKNILEPIIEWLKKSCNQNKIDSCLKRARGLFDGRITDFDQDNFLLNVQNGIINLKTGELLPHDKGRMCSRICRAEYSPILRGAASLWTKTLEAIVPNEQERHYLQKWAGYMLTGSAAEEKLLFLYGEGGSGKGTFLNTLGWMMGDYADTIDIEIFLASRNDGHAGGAAASPEIAKLAGIRTAIASESGVGRKMNDAKVKNLTGRDDITARFLYGQQFTFSPMVKFVIMSNYLPAVSDANDSGIARRLVIAPFMEDLETQRDIHLKEKLKEPKNLAAVLAWCVDGCLMWQQEGLGEPPPRYAQQARRFYADSDTLQQFIDDECITGPRVDKVRAKVKDFHERYQEWTGEHIKRKTLVTLMERKDFHTDRFEEGRCFIGVQMKPRQEAFRRDYHTLPF